MMKTLGTSSVDPQTNAFLRACQVESDPLDKPFGLQMIELRAHIDRRWDEMLRACKDISRQPALPVPQETLQQPTVLEETLQQLCKASAETVSEVKSLRRQTSNLEERFMQHIANLLTQQTPGVVSEVARSADSPLGQTSAEMRLEARLMNIQQSHSARLEEVLQQCHHLHALLGELSTQRDKHQVPLVFDDPSESPACTPREPDHDTANAPAWMLSAEPDPRASQTPSLLKDASAATQDVMGLMQTLGWSNEAGNDVRDEVMDEDFDVIRCRVYLQWMSMALVSINAIFMGIAAEAGLACAIHKKPHPDWARVGDIVFFFLFVGELLVRLAVDKWKFCYGADIGWNTIDVVTTLLMGLEVAFSIGGNASFLRAMRLLRFMRALRALHLFRSLRIARLMFLSLYNIVWPLACTLAFLLFILYLTSLGVSQIVEQYIFEDGGSEDLLELYGSLWATMFTFFMAIMGGAEWRQLLRPLRAVSGLLVFIFVIVEVFTIFGITNLLSAIIIDGVIRNSQTNERLAMRASMVEQRSAVNELRELLIALPQGTKELKKCKSVAQVLKGQGKHHLESMGIEVQTALGMLKMLDTEDIGCIHIDEFLCSLSQLHAENMSVHMTTTIYESKKILHSIAALRRLMEESSCSRAAAKGRVGSFSSDDVASDRWNI